MLAFILDPKFIFFAGMFSWVTYSFWHRQKALKPFSVTPKDNKQELLRLQSAYGYNEHSLVSVSCNTNFWFAPDLSGGISYTKFGKIWLVAGEPIADEENILPVTQKFLQTASENKKIVVFMPTTERFAGIVSRATDLQAVKIGAAPYFDLQNWNPRGNKAKCMRAGLNQARRKQISIEEVKNITDDFQAEVLDLCQKWKNTKFLNIEFKWLFELSPFKNADQKKFFIARSETGKLIGFMAASPIPARDGWYLEDVLRAPDAPNGTADLLVFETLKSLTQQGAKVATLGTVPLTQDGSDEFVSESYITSKALMRFSCRNLNSFYNFAGLRHFKAKFVPSWWESQYVLLPKGLFVPHLVFAAFLYAIFRRVSGK